MSWTEFLIRVFGGVAALVVFLVVRESWRSWSDRRGK
jgi:hypothetical protein